MNCLASAAPSQWCALCRNVNPSTENYLIHTILFSTLCCALGKDLEALRPYGTFFRYIKIYHSSVDIFLTCTPNPLDWYGMCVSYCGRKLSIVNTVLCDSRHLTGQNFVTAKVRVFKKFTTPNRKIPL